MSPDSLASIAIGRLPLTDLWPLIRGGLGNLFSYWFGL